MGEEGDSNMANANAKATANANSNTNVNAANALLPSQTITSKPRQRNRRKRKPKSANNPNNADVESDNAGSTHNNTSTNETKMKPKPDTTRTTRTRTRKKKDSKKVEGNAKPDPNTDPNSNQNNDNKTASKAKKKAKPKKRNKKKFSWRKEVPPNTVDPISLEPLVSLPYPPFALTITPPYDIIPDWPIPVPVNGTNANTSSDSAKATSGTNKDSKQNGNGKKGFQKTNGVFDSAQCEIETKKRQDLLIQKQWGDALPKLKNSELSPILGQNGGGEDSGSEVKANTALETKQNDETKESDVEEDTIFDADADADADANIEKEIIVKEEKQHFHLFDGRVLAVYLVSTLQFIDPLNRRDLTRDEVKNLDAYLAKHHLKKIRVLEAYDDKGVSMSTAGASAQTPSGRLRMRQEQASNLLASLFQDNVGVSSQQQQSQLQSRRTNNRSGTRNRQNGDRNGNNISNDNSNTYRDNTISNQYASYEMNHQLQQQAYGYGSENANANANDGSQYGFGYGYGSQWNFDEGGYADNEGMLIIDDDVNPGLRGGVPQSYNPNTNNSAHVVDWHGHRAQGGESFPSLPSAGPRTSTGTESTTNPEQQASSTQQQKKPKPISKSLSKIGNVVHKTSKKQLEKQRKARELAMRKAELASMPFEEAVKRSLLGDDGSTPSQMPTLRQPIRPLGHVEPTEGQLERNLKFSTALDVKPSTMRGCLNSGWTRPTSSFRDELNEINYPDELIIEARERMTELLRFEKKIITFLKNDKAASIPLKPMDRPLRKFIHHYSDFWNLHTESFDPAPNRYIHCVKLLETRAPQTLLSTAVRTWRGPTPAPLPPTAQSAGEDTMSSAREFIQTEERAPLKLEPRSASNVVPPPGAMFDLQLDIAGIDIAATSNDKNLLSSLSREPAARFAPMLAERERPVLKLDARTKPLELPQYQPQSTLSVNTAEMSVNYKKRLNVSSDRKRKDLEKKKKIVAAAFCSDSDDEDDSDSDWEVQEALVTASDNE